MYRLIFFLLLLCTACRNTQPVSVAHPPMMNGPCGACLSGILNAEDGSRLGLMAVFLLRQDSNVSVVVSVTDFTNDTSFYLVDEGQMVRYTPSAFEMQSAGNAYPWTFRMDEGVLKVDFFSGGQKPFRVKITTKDYVTSCYCETPEHIYHSTFNNSELMFRSGGANAKFGGSLRLTRLSGIVPLPEDDIHFIMVLPSDDDNNMAAAIMDTRWQVMHTFNPKDSCTQWFAISSVDTVHKTPYVIPCRLFLKNADTAMRISFPKAVRPIPFHKHFLLPAFGSIHKNSAVNGKGVDKKAYTVPVIIF